MSFSFRGCCVDCGHQWDGLCRVYVCGQVDFQEPATHRCYLCPTCFVHLYVPRRLNRSSWLRWVHENASEVTSSPLLFKACELGVRVDLQSLAVIARSLLLFGACERVARILARERSRYLPVPIDIGTMSCAKCREPMLDGDIESNALVCPRCESRSARSNGEQHPETVFVDYRPLDDDLVRRVILYLKNLAEYRKNPGSNGALTPPSDEDLVTGFVQVRDPLWDHELDGESCDCVQLPSPALGLDVLDALLDRRMFAGLGNCGNPRGHRVQINISTYR